MVWLAVVACLFAVGCGRHHEPPARGPSASQDMRCTLRISPRGIFVDGEPTSRGDAVAYCKGTSGAVVVIEDRTTATSEWDQTTRQMVVVVIEDKAIKAEWDETRTALEREAVRIYVRGPLCYGPHRFSCRLRQPVPIGDPEMEPRRIPSVEPLLRLPPAPTPPIVSPPQSE